MATFDKRKGAAGFPRACQNQDFNLNARVAFSECTGLAAADVISVLDVPVGCVVYGVYAKVITACAAAMTATIGDAGDADGWITSLALNGTAETITAGAGAYVVAGGKPFTTATPITMTIGGTAGASGVVEIVALARRIFPD